MNNKQRVLSKHKFLNAVMPAATQSQLTTHWQMAGALLAASGRWGRRPM
jgi:hypothetical protein